MDSLCQGPDWEEDEELGTCWFRIFAAMKGQRLWEGLTTNEATSEELLLVSLSRPKASPDGECDPGPCQWSVVLRFGLIPAHGRQDPLSTLHTRIHARQAPSQGIRILVFCFGKVVVSGSRLWML